MQGINGRPTVNWSQSIDLLREAALAAADAVLPFWRKDPQVWMKAGRSPVSEADYAADKVLKAFLLNAEPDFNWISEESDPQQKDELAPSFVVDPIDGTRGFLAGQNDWCISIAIVADARPVAGVLYQPTMNTFFECIAGEGAKVNGRRISVGRETSLVGAHIGATKSAARPLLSQIDGLVLAPYCASLALRLAHVATGDLDIAVAGANAADWDLAAADLLVHEAGGVLVDENCAPTLYGKAPYRHPRLTASNETLIGQLYPDLTSRTAASGR